MATEQEHHWIEILAGRDVDNADPKTYKEAAILRKMILESYHQEEGDVLARERGAKRLLERLEREGLLNETKRKLFWRPVSSSIAAAAILVAVTFVWMRPSYDPLTQEMSPDFIEPLITRSGISIQSIETHDIYKTADSLRQQVSSLNIPYRFTPVEDGWELDIFIPLDPSKETLTFLEQWRLKETESGWIRIIPEIPRN